MSFDRRVPIFPTRRDFVSYLHRYVEVLELPVETGRAGDGDRARLAMAGSSRLSRVRSLRGAVVVATGIVSAPRMPSVPGRELFTGRVMHSVDYRRPEGFEGRRVLVVGVGNSGGEIGERARGRWRARDGGGALRRERRAARAGGDSDSVSRVCDARTAGGRASPDRRRCRQADGAASR